MTRGQVNPSLAQFFGAMGGEMGMSAEKMIENLEQVEEEKAEVEAEIEVAEKMDAGETFVVFASFENCPWCNLLIPYLNDAAAEAGVTVGYIDTRANPEWSNNMDIDDYDLFVEKFGKYLKEDDDGKPHLYTPDTYFIKNGKIVAQHVGVTPGVENPSDPLTSEQEEKLRKDLANEFSKLN